MIGKSKRDKKILGLKMTPGTGHHCPGCTIELTGWAIIHHMHNITGKTWPKMTVNEFTFWV